MSANLKFSPLVRVADCVQQDEALVGEAREPSVVVGHVHAEVAALPAGRASPEFGGSLTLSDSAAI